MKNEFVYGAGNLLKKIKAGKPVFLPEYYTDSEGNWVEKQVEIKSEQEFESYVRRNQYIQDFLKQKKATVASKIYANALYALTSPANTTIAGGLLSGKEFNSSKFYRAGNIPQSKDAIYGVLNTFSQDMWWGDIGYEVELPKVKRTKTQTLKLIKKGVEGFFVPEIDKDGLVVSAGLGRDHFDCNFVGVSTQDVTEEQLREYLKAPFGDYADNVKVDFDKIVELCKKAYKEMALHDGMYPDVREIMHECMMVYPLSFARMKDKEVVPGPVPVPIPDPVPVPDPIPDPVPDPVPFPPKPPKKETEFVLRPIRNSRVGIVESDGKGGFCLRKGSSTSVEEVIEIEK